MTNWPTIKLAVEGLPGAEVDTVGQDAVVSGMPLVQVDPDQGREIRVLVTIPRTTQVARSTHLTFRATDVAPGETATAKEHFIAR